MGSTIHESRIWPDCVPREQILCRFGNVLHCCGSIALAYWRARIRMGKDMQSEHHAERIHKVRDAQAVEANGWFKDLYDHFASVRAEIIARGVGEDEVNADIAAALREVRTRRV